VQADPVSPKPAAGRGAALNVPNLLTWLRMLAIPLLVAVLFLPIEQQTINLIATALFVAAAVTDWVDGWLARKLGQT